MTEKPIAVVIYDGADHLHWKATLSKALRDLRRPSFLETTLRNVQKLNPHRIIALCTDPEARRDAALKSSVPVELNHQPGPVEMIDAMRLAASSLHEFEGDVLLLPADLPLLSVACLKDMIERHRQSCAMSTVLTARIPITDRVFHSQGTGINDVSSGVQALLEGDSSHLDGKSKREESDHVVAPVVCIHGSMLKQAVENVKAGDDSGIHLIENVISSILPSLACCVGDYCEALRVRNCKEFAVAHKMLQTRVKDMWMDRGVVMTDADSISIDETVELEENVVLDGQTHLRGKTSIGAGCRIGPGSLIENSTIEKDCKVLFSVVTDSTIGMNTWIGPYAHLRANSFLGEGCRVGNFVEIKNGKLGNTTFAAHLSYLGDADLGNNVNIGAGTITANFDGRQKHKTVIGDGAKTGSNSTLVAPVRIGERVTIAAGSTITQDVTDNGLVIARARQVVKKDWKPKT